MKCHLHNSFKQVIMHGCVLSKHVCYYYLTEPLDHIRINGLFNFSYTSVGAFDKAHCISYSPCVPDGGCRYCGISAIHHRKYYIYSIFVRKIQKAYFFYKFRKLIHKKIKNYSFFSKDGLYFYHFFLKFYLKNIGSKKYLTETNIDYIMDLNFRKIFVN